MKQLQKVASRRFGQYNVVRRLGEGGMAVVYLAEAVDERGNMIPVALKFMKPRVDAPGVDASDLFAVEGDVMGLLRHPSLVNLYEVGKLGETMYFAMEYCPGGDLEALISALRWQDKPFPPSVALQIGIDLLKALAYVHQAQGVRGTSLGLVHGDINPANIFVSLDESRPKLGDFGVVTSSVLGTGLPEGAAAGKLHYLSPEQAQGKPLTAQSDLFALGVVMFELLLGRKPFDGPDAETIIERICAGRYDLPSHVSDPLASVFEKALARNPRSRFPSAGAFAGDLLRYQLETGLQESPRALRDLAEEALQILA
ncbi:MAG: serine/threonine protein kinase [Deltaproteobacteria bacterium]|nr:serine/threonine protein kinase [Deltaproteobacteria bacterium]